MIQRARLLLFQLILSELLVMEAQEGSEELNIMAV